MADAVAAARSASRSAHIRQAPSAANRMAIAVPIPPPAPVTGATFSLSRITAPLAILRRAPFARPGQALPALYSPQSLASTQRQNAALPGARPRQATGFGLAASFSCDATQARQRRAPANPSSPS